MVDYYVPKLEAALKEPFDSATAQLVHNNIYAYMSQGGRLSVKERNLFKSLKEKLYAKKR